MYCCVVLVMPENLNKDCPKNTPTPKEKPLKLNETACVSKKQSKPRKKKCAHVNKQRKTKLLHNKQTHLKRTHAYEICKKPAPN